MDARTLAFERSPAGIVFVRVIAEQGEVGGIGSRADAGAMVSMIPQHPFRCEFVKNGFFCCGKRGESPQLGAGTIGDAVKDNKKDLVRGHSYGMVGRAE